MKRIILSILILTALSLPINAQVNGVLLDPTNSLTKDVSAVLDVSALSSTGPNVYGGFLAPRVALTATNAAGPITSPATGLFVYNTATAGVAPNNVIPGYYYNAGTTVAPNWVRFAAGTALGYIENQNSAPQTADYYISGSGRANNFLSSNGTVAAPAYGFASQTNTGVYLAGASDWRVAIAGTWRFRVGAGYAQINGTVRPADGTAAAPAFTFSADLDNGMWRPGADIIAFSTAATERMRIDNIGGVGIGTTSVPAETKLVLGSVDGASEGGQLQLNPAGANTTAYFLDVYGNAFRIMRGTTASSSAVNIGIESNGNVNIGTAVAADRFTVGNSNEFRVSSTGDLVRIDNVVYDWPAANAAGALLNNGSGTLSWGNGSSLFTAGTGLSWSGNTLNSLWTANGTHIYNNNAANVGIGSATPGEKLDVVGNIRGTNMVSVTSGNGKGFRFWDSDSYKIHMGNAAENLYGPVTDYSIKMNMSNTVGRGWTWGVTGLTPVAALNTSGTMQVAGDMTAVGNFYGRSVDAQYSSIYRMGGIFFTWDSDSYGTNTHHSIRSTYGDTYGDELTMNSYNNIRFNIDANNNDATSYWEVGHHTTDVANILLRLESPSGNLGIGTTTPAEKLHVIGNTRVSTLAGTGNRPVYADANGTLTITPFTPFTRVDPLYVRGTGLNNSANRVLRIGNTEVYNTTGGRGLRLTIITKATHAVVSTTDYDTYGDATASNNLATALNGITNSQLGVLTSYDAWEGNITTNLRNAFQRLGLYKALMTTVGGSRRPYAAIFEASSNSGVPSVSAVEIEHSDNGNQPYAELRGHLIDGSYVAASQAPSGLSTPVGAFAVGVNESGNVGIGGNSPAVKLAVGSNGTNVYNTDVWVENNIHVQGNEALTQGGRGRLRVGTAWSYVGLYAENSSTGVANDLVLGAGSGIVRVGSNGGSGQHLRWSNSLLRDDQGGSIELGAQSGAAGTGTPYIDFHVNSGYSRDYDLRLIAQTDGYGPVLTMYSYEGNTLYRYLDLDWIGGYDCWADVSAWRYYANDWNSLYDDLYNDLDLIDNIKPTRKYDPKAKVENVTNDPSTVPQFLGAYANDNADKFMYDINRVSWFSIGAIRQLRQEGKTREQMLLDRIERLESMIEKLTGTQLEELTFNNTITVHKGLDNFVVIDARIKQGDKVVVSGLSDFEVKDVRNGSFELVFHQPLPADISISYTKE